MRKNRVFIAVPSGDMVQARFTASLVGLLAISLHHAEEMDLEIYYGNQISSRITENRNTLVKMAEEKDATHILFIDSDMTFPAGALLELLTHDRDIIGATASKRREEDAGKAIGITLKPDDVVSNLGNRLVPMQLMGLPFTLIKMDVFKKLVKPYFAEPFDHNGDVVPEDNFFYINAFRAGFEILCDTALSMQMGHWGVKEYKIEPQKAETPMLRLVEAAE